MLAGSTIDEADYAVLQGALAKLQAELVRVETPAPPCESGAARVEPGVRVWVSWQPEQLVQLCFEDRSGRHARTLGPFAHLHGSAREQLMTVIESGLQAAEAAEAEIAARETPAAPAAPAAPPPAAPPPAAAAPAAPDRATLTLGWRPALGVGLTSWSSRALATRVDAALAVTWLERALDLRVELSFTPAITVTNASPRLALSAQSWRIGLAASQWFPVYERLGAQLYLGAALEHVRVKPAESAANVKSRHATSHMDPVLFARVGPTLELGAHFRLSLLVGAELVLKPRRYGFTVGESDQVVLDLARVRPSVLAEISTAL